MATTVPDWAQEKAAPDWAQDTPDWAQENKPKPIELGAIENPDLNSYASTGGRDGVQQFQQDAQGHVFRTGNPASNDSDLVQAFGKRFQEDPKAATKELAELQVGMIGLPFAFAGKTLNVLAQDAGAVIGGNPEGYGNTKAFFTPPAPGSAVEPQPLPYEKNLKEISASNPVSATVGKIGSGTTEMIPMLLAGQPEGALGKLVTAKFLYEMTKGGSQAAGDLYAEMKKPKDERNMDSITSDVSELVQSGLFLPGMVKHLSMTSRGNMIRTLSDHLKNTELEQPSDSQLLRDTSPKVAASPLVADASEKAADSNAPLTASALRQMPKTDEPVVGGNVDPSIVKLFEDEAATTDTEPVGKAALVKSAMDKNGENLTPEEQAAWDEHRSSNMPDWVTENLKTITDPLEKSGVAQKVEDLSAQRKTAGEIATELGIEPEQVRAVRAVRKIPALDETDAFDAWVKSKETGQPTEPPKTIIKGITSTSFGGGVHEVDAGGRKIRVRFVSAKEEQALHDNGIIDKDKWNGVWMGNEMLLPSRPRTDADPTFTHEMVHALRDHGLISDAQWKSLLKLNSGRREQIRATYKDYFDSVNRTRVARGDEPFVFSEGDLDHEVAADLLERWHREGNAPVPKWYHKILQYVRSIWNLPKTATEHAQDLLEGKFDSVKTDLEGENKASDQEESNTVLETNVEEHALYKFTKNYAGSTTLKSEYFGYPYSKNNSKTWTFIDRDTGKSFSVWKKDYAPEKLSSEKADGKAAFDKAVKDGWEYIRSGKFQEDINNFKKQFFGDAYREHEQKTYSSPNGTSSAVKTKEAILEAKKNGASPEFRALFGGIDPEKAGTTPEKVLAFAKGLGLEWRPLQSIPRASVKDGNKVSDDEVVKAGLVNVARGTRRSDWESDMLTKFGTSIGPRLDDLWERTVNEFTARHIIEQQALNLKKWSEEGADAIRKQVLNLKPDETPKQRMEAWVDHMTSMFGDDVKPELERIYRESREQAEMPVTDKRQPNPEKRPDKKIVIGEMAALKEVLKAKEKASEEAFAAGEKEGSAFGKAEATGKLLPRIAELKAKMSDMVSKTAALKEYFKGQEKAGKTAKAATERNLAMTDRWMEATSRELRDGLKKAVATLPKSERHRFTNRIAEIGRRPSILDPDMSASYAKMRNLANEIHREALMTAIRSTVARALESKSVAVEVKQQIRQVMDGLTTKTERGLNWLKKQQETLERLGASGADVFIPKKIVEQLGELSKKPIKDFSLAELAALHEKISTLEQAGRETIKSEKELREMRYNDLLRQLEAENSRPKAGASESATVPGEKATRAQVWFDRTRIIRKAALDVVRGRLPIAAIMDSLDGLGETARGNYKGFFSRALGRYLVNENAKLRMSEQLSHKFLDLVRQHDLKRHELERVDIYAHVQQGLKDRLRATNPDIDVNLTLTPSEMAFYNEGRTLFGQTYKLISDKARELYNIELPQYENYWPIRVDGSKLPVGRSPLQEIEESMSGGIHGFDEMNALNVVGASSASGFRSTKTEQGFTIERIPKANTPLKLNALETVAYHINAVSHFISHQEELSLMGRVARTDLAKTKAGDWGQQFLMNWLDTVAKDGGGQSVGRSQMLDFTRRNIVVAETAANVFIAPKHLGSAFFSYVLVTPEYFHRGVSALMTPEGRQFLTENFPAICRKVSSEPDLQDVASHGNWLFDAFGEKASELFSKGLEKGSMPLRYVDFTHSAITAMAAYQRELALRGINPDEYATHPVDKEALGRAMIISGRTTASTAAGAQPPVLTRGTGAFKNASIGRFMNIFGNTILDVQSLLSHDLPESLKVANKNRDVASTTFAGFLVAATVAMIVYEAGVSKAQHSVRNIVTNNDDTEKQADAQSWEKQIEHSALRVVPLPYLGNIAAAAMHQETGNPVVDLGIKTLSNAPKIVNGKTEASRTTAAFQTAETAAQLAGIPLSGQISQAVEKIRK